MKIPERFTIVLTIALLMPFVVIAALSFSNNWRYPSLLPSTWQYQHWLSLFTSQTNIGYSLGLSIITAFFVACFSTFAGFFISRSIAQHPLKKWWLFMAYCPFILSPVVYAACMQYFFVRYNLSGQLLGVVIAQSLVTFPYAVIVFMSFWTKKMQQYEQIVFTLGGSTLQAFIKVLLPLSKGTLAIVFFQTFLISCFEYGLTSLIGLGKVPTLPLVVYQYVNEASISFAAISSCLLIFPPVILLWINKRFLLRPMQ